MDETADAGRGRQCWTKDESILDEAATKTRKDETRKFFYHVNKKEFAVFFNFLGSNSD